VLRIEYYTQGRGELSERDVEPLRLQRLKQHWYVVAWCRKADDIRSFRLDRIKSLEVLRERFEDRGVDLTGYEADTPRTLEDAPRVAQVLFAPSAAGYVLENSTDATRLVDGSALQRVATAGDTWLLEEILKYRGQATVVTPGDLRERIAARAGELRELLVRVPAAC
jgi:proteasome accessory factor C